MKKYTPRASPDKTVNESLRTRTLFNEALLSHSAENARRDCVLGLTQISDLIEQEEQLSAETLNLTANETILSPFAQRVLSSPLCNRYLLEHIDMRGDSPSRDGNFLYRGLNRINDIERSAAEVCKEMFGSQYVEFRCLSGMHAMQTTFASLTNPGEKIMRFATIHGGHFLTQRLCELFGRKSCCYAFNIKTFQIDLEQTREVFIKEKPVLLYIDAMNYLFPFPVRELREIVGETSIVYDASHTLGLIAGGQFQDPLSEGADILQANTHKTFFGPQKGIIMGNNRELMEKIIYNLTTGLISSQHTASTISLFIAIHEMMINGKEYAKRVIENAKYLAEQLYNKGFDILAADLGFTQNHMFFIDVRRLGSGLKILDTLLQANISVNRVVPFEHIDAIRVGVQEITRLGYSKNELDNITTWFDRILLKGENPFSIGNEVRELTGSRKKVFFCGDMDHKGNEIASVLTTEKKRVTSNSRWVDFNLKQDEIDLDTDKLSELQTIANLANSFSQQTDLAGNISARLGNKIFVKASGTYMKDLKKEDFVEILGVKDYTLFCKGIGPPSAEAYMHYLVYENTDSNFVVHNHCIPTDNEIKALNIIVVPPVEYGSISLAQSVANACRNGNIVYVQRHGLVFHFVSVDEAVKTLTKFDLMRGSDRRLFER